MLRDAELSSSIGAIDAALIADGLANANEAALGPAHRESLYVLQRSLDRVVAGLQGYTAWRTLHVEKIWVEPAFRRQGLAARLLAIAEQAAIARLCTISWLDTVNPVAAGLYLNFGYEICGRIVGFANGRDRIFMTKSLAQESQGSREKDE